MLKQSLFLSIIASAVVSCTSSSENEFSHLDYVVANGRQYVIDFAGRSMAKDKSWRKGKEAAELLRITANRDNITLKYLIDIGIDPDGRGVPPAANAIWGNNDRNLRLILAAGANPNKVWKDGEGTRQSLLTIAYRENAKDCVPVLLEAGATTMPSNNEAEKKDMNLWLDSWRNLPSNN